VSKPDRRSRARASQPDEPDGRPAAVLLLHVQPRAARTEVVGRHGDAIKIRLRAPPVDGAANDELLRFLAERLGVARSALRLVAGESGRRKRVAVTGGPPDPESRLLAPPRA
jgi:uncharacterized protein